MAWSQAKAGTGNKLGIDVSHWEPSANINWSTLASADGISFVYAKITDGTSTVDSEVLNHITNAKAHGFPIGFYHFEEMATGSSYSLTDADNQATFFANTIISKMNAAGYSGYGDLMPCLDLERPDPSLGASAANLTTQQIVDWAQRFMATFKSITGRTCILYTSKYMYDTFSVTTAQANELNVNPLWDAEYYQYGTIVNDTPTVFGGWSNWTMWQYTQTGTITSYTGNIDIDWGPTDLAWLKVPSSPTGVTGSQVGSTSVVLNWHNNPEVDIAGYNIYNGSTFLAYVTTNTYTATGLSNGTYTFKVQAKDQYGDVSNSTLVSVTVNTSYSPPPPLPTGSSKIQLTIGGLDYTTFTDFESVSVDNNIVMTSDSATLIIQLDGELARPRVGQEFIWRTVDTASGAELTREFGGVVVTVQEDTEGTSLIYTVTVKSYDHWFDRHLVVAWYNQDLASNIIKLVVQQFCPGFTTNNVVTSTNTTIIPQYFNYSKPTEAIKMIADQLEWGFFIDYYKDVHFAPLTTLKTPLPNNVLDVDNDLVSYGDLELIEDGQQVFNKVILRGFKTRSSTPMTLSFLGDGSTLQWSMGYRASSVKGDVKVAVYSSLANYKADTSFQTTGVPSGYGGVLMTMAKDIVDGAPNQPAASNTAYIHYTQHLLRLPNYNGAGILPSGYCIGVFFYYLKDVVYMGQDVQAQSILAKLEGTDGIYEYSVEDKSLTNSTIAAPQAKAQLMLMKYSLPQISGSFTSFTSGWKAGQYFTLVTKKRMGGISAPMYVLRVTKTLVNNINGQYVLQNVIEFANSPYLV